jgi:hypothetical protein
MKFSEMNKPPYQRLNIGADVWVFRLRQPRQLQVSYWKNLETGQVYEVFRGQKRKMYRLHNQDGSVSPFIYFDQEES